VADPARERALSTPDRAEGAGRPADATPGPLIPPDLEATIVLVRHGESTFIEEGRFQGQAETPLSSHGRRQAQRAAERLAHPGASPALPIPAGQPLEIVHSPLGRAAETAGAVGAAMAAADAFGRDVPLRPDPGLLEIGQGEWEGLHHAEIEARWGDVLATWRLRPLEAWAPGGESIPVVAARVRRSLEVLINRLATSTPTVEPSSEPAVPRSHVAGYRGAAAGGPWSVIVGHDGVFKVVLLTLFDLPLERFWMWSSDLCGISVLEIRAGRPVVRAMNLTEHLASLLDDEAQAEMKARTRSGAL
jgi:phosphoserine phosphatase